MKKRILGAIFSVVSLVGLCNTSVVEAAEHVKIGINLELSGDQGDQGYSCYEGVRLAIDEFNRAGGLHGRKVVIIAGSNRSTSMEAAKIAEKHIKEDVSAIIAPIKYSNVTASAKVLEASNIPMISPGATDSRTTLNRDGTVRANVFRLLSPDTLEAQVIAKFGRTGLKARTAAIYVDKSREETIDLATAFQNAFEDGGGEVSMIKTFEPKDMAYDVTLQNLKFSRPDIIFIAGSPQQAGEAIRTLREAGIKTPILGISSWESSEILTYALPENLNEVYFSNAFASASDDHAVKDFVELYKKRYWDETPDSYAALGYDSARIILDIMVKTESTDPEVIRGELENLKNYKGVTGEITMGKEHEALRSMMILEYEEGVTKLKEKVMP